MEPVARKKPGRKPSTVGRPRVSKDERLIKPVSFRLKQRDYDTWMSKVAASGMSESDFFRAAIINNETKVQARPRVSEDKKKVLFIANKASNNINQLAHRVNSDALAGVVSEKTYEDTLYELQLVSKLFKATLGNVD